ncbi:MAG: HAMP domain-containing protein [Deltaproteobacteria bacterium]|nr:HAMP domain-containing protein [Deltaproteobacteria bacterium]
MLQSIRNKTIFGILILILLIQVISTVLQSYQVRSIFAEEFVLGAQNLTQSVFNDLTKKVIGYDGSEEEIDAEEIREKVGFIIQINQIDDFNSILNSKEDLLGMQFIDFQGQLIVTSLKNKDGIEHFNLAKNPDIKADDMATELAKAGNLGLKMEKGRIYLFIPLVIKEVKLGGMVLLYSDHRLANAEKQIYLTGAILVAIFMVVSMIMVILFVRSIVTRPIQDMIQLMTSLAAGELDQRFESKQKNEISKMGNSVNELVIALQSVFISIDDVMGGVEKGDLSRKIVIDLKGDLDSVKKRINQSILLLSETIFSVKSTSQSVEQSAKELSNSADVLSSSSTKQAATIEEVSSAIAEIESHSKQNTEHSKKAKAITDETLELVNRGNRQMEEMQTSMDEINNTSQNVSKIIKVFDEIAFQTNLLALNAAVEAARAGKYGKGFSVVAEEVRNLAARSAEAAHNTSTLIESSMKEVESGVEKANQTSGILKEIVTEVQKSSELIKLIAEASQEQTQGISEIYTGISQVNATVQQNSAIAEETASSSEVLLNQSVSLQQEIQRFKLSDEQSDSFDEGEPAQIVSATVIADPIRQIE